MYIILLLVYYAEECCECEKRTTNGTVKIDSFSNSIGLSIRHKHIEVGGNIFKQLHNIL